MIDRSFSLASALQVIAGKSGRTDDVDDLQAVLGLSMVPCAVPSSTDPSSWSMYARDACLQEAGRALGMVIRPVHPPEAARGLAGTAEFMQHFDASYRPLITGALDNGQAVLAWQGWPGEHRLMWGVIDGASDEGIGFSGNVVSGTQPSAPAASIALERPAVQLYVVETVGKEEPSAGELLTAAVKHARVLLKADVASRFGVMTGPNAVNCALEALRSKRGDGPVSPTFMRGHQEFAASATAGYASAVRFLTRQEERLGGEHKIVTESLSMLCRRAITALARSSNHSAVQAALSVPEGRVVVLKELTEAADAARDMVSILQIRAKEMGIA